MTPESGVTDEALIAGLAKLPPEALALALVLQSRSSLGVNVGDLIASYQKQAQNAEPALGLLHEVYAYMLATEFLTQTTIFRKLQRYILGLTGQPS